MRLARIGAGVVLASLAQLACSLAAPRPLVADDEGAAQVGSSSWSPPVLLEPVASLGATRCGEWLYVYSGHTGQTHRHSVDNLSKTFARVSLLDGRSWELLPCPTPLQSVVLVTHRGASRPGGRHDRAQRGRRGRGPSLGGGGGSL